MAIPLHDKLWSILAMCFMNKLIILFLILGILVIGCSKDQTYAQQPTQPSSPSIQGGCSVSENENQETKVKYVGVEAGL